MVGVLLGHCTLQFVYCTIDTTTPTTPYSSNQAAHKQHTMVEPFAATAEWLLRFKPTHPEEPLQKGLIEGEVAGFYTVL